MAVSADDWTDDPQAVDSFITRAKAVLDDNWTGRFTVPSPSLYPHQWSWDAGFVVLAYARYAQERAEQELAHLFAGQWKNGMIPQIVFNPDAPDTYFPGPDYWDAGRSPHAPDGVRTTGIIQPPVHATAVWHYQHFARDKERAVRFVERVYPLLAAWHHFLRRDRCSRRGLIHILHPWESGQDNSPIWDTVRKRTDVPEAFVKTAEAHRGDYIHKKTRPTRKDYSFYLYLVELFRAVDYDPKRMREVSPFVIQDVLFNTLYCRSLLDLGHLAHLIGEDPLPWWDEAHVTQVRMNEKLWNEHHGMYFDHDLTTNRRIKAEVAAGFTPLYAGIPRAAQAARMVRSLDSPKFYQVDERSWGVPSYDRESRKFSKSRYWRGPVWININWILCHGLRHYGYYDYAEHVRHAILKLPYENGFWEYFDPETGEGLGSDHFSWTAALALELILQPEYAQQVTEG